MDIKIDLSNESQNTVDKLVQRANASLLIGTSSWKEQFIEAVTVSAGKQLSFFNFLLFFGIKNRLLILGFNLFSFFQNYISESQGQ